MPMLSANLKILSELKDFITTISNNKLLLQKFSRCEKDFSRNRKLPFTRLAILISKLCKKTLSVELERFFEDISLPGSCSVSAFSQQRLKLDPFFFNLWNHVLTDAFYHYYGSSAKLWEGYRVIAADGSTVSLINNTSLSNYFGGQSNQQSGFVLAKTFYHYDVLNELVVASQIKPYRYGELNMAYDAIEHLQPDMLSIYDRNFCNYKMVALHTWQESERKFVIRAKESQKLIKAFIESGEQSSVVYMEPTKFSIEGLRKCGYIVDKKTFLKVRLVRVELQNTIEVLMTNLWEEQGHGPEIFKELYFMRWGVETNISVQKNIMQLESFSGLTAHTVLQDFYATVFTANLHSILIKHSQHTVDSTMKHRKYPMKINKNKSFGKLKMNIISLFIDNNVGQILLKLHDQFIKEVIPVRKGRSFPRIRKNRQSNSKFKTFSNFKPTY
jgi:hypothetical protein